MKSITLCVSAKVYVDAQKIGSVIASPAFWRASPAWTATVEKPSTRMFESPVIELSPIAMNVGTYRQLGDRFNRLHKKSRNAQGVRLRLCVPGQSLPHSAFRAGSAMAL